MAEITRNLGSWKVLYKYSVIFQNYSLNYVKHDFVGSFEDLMDAEIAKDTLNWVVLEVAIATVHLEGVVDDIKTFVSRKFFCHCTIHGIIRIPSHNTIRPMPNHKSTRFKICSHLSQLKLKILIGRKWRSKLLPLFDIFLCNFQTFGSPTERATSNVESTTVEAWECNFETLTLGSK